MQPLRIVRLSDPEICPELQVHVDATRAIACTPPAADDDAGPWAAAVARAAAAVINHLEDHLCPDGRPSDEDDPTMPFP